MTLVEHYRAAERCAHRAQVIVERGERLGVRDALGVGLLLGVGALHVALSRVVVADREPGPVGRPAQLGRPL